MRMLTNNRYNLPFAELRSAGQPRAAVPTQFVFFFRLRDFNGCILSPQAPSPSARDDKPHFVTFCTYKKAVLPEAARHIVLQCCLHDNGIKLDVHCVVVMPDHVHMIFVPLINGQKNEVYSLAEIMDAIKGASAHQINRALQRKGKVWQTESFDHVVRSSESLDQKIQYVRENPMRRGIVQKSEDYVWMWQKPFDNPYSPTCR